MHNFFLIKLKSIQKPLQCFELRVIIDIAISMKPKQEVQILLFIQAHDHIGKNIMKINKV